MICSNCSLIADDLLCLSCRAAIDKQLALGKVAIAVVSDAFEAERFSPWQFLVALKFIASENVPRGTMQHNNVSVIEYQDAKSAGLLH